VTTLHPFETVMSSFSGGDGTYALHVDELWEGQPGNVFGGFLVASVVRAAGLESTMPRPVSSSCQFLRPATVGAELEFEVVSLRRGRSSELVRVSISQQGKEVVEAQVRTALGGDGPVCAPRQPPASEDPRTWPSGVDTMREQGIEPPRMFACWETRYTTDGGGIEDRRDSAFWARLADGATFADPYLEASRWALSLDSQAGALIHRIGAEHSAEPLPWGFSNLDSLVHFHRAQGSEWILSENKVLTGSDGLAGVQSQVWSETGDLLATAMSQLAFFPLRDNWSFAREAQA
jgi:acyl-CoA thioesterase